MGGDDLPLGGKPGKDKGPNLIKRSAAEAKKQPQINVQAQEDPLGEFGDGSKMGTDWRGNKRVVANVLRQSLEICWAIVLARLLQAIFNITDLNDYKEFSHDDLVVHLKMNKKQSSLELQNIKDATKHIAVNGLLKLKSSGRTKPGSSVGYKGKWNFITEKSPSAAFIKSKVGISPVAISFEIGGDFHDLKKDIYKVEDLLSQLGEGAVEGHAVLIVGYGYANGRLFFLVQNSWGYDWGVKGFGRIFIDENSKSTIVYPEVLN